MQLTYPIILTPDPDGQDTYVVTAPDLPGLVTFGNSLTEALSMAIDAASGWILDELEEGHPLPQPTPLLDVTTDHADDLTTLILLDIDAYAQQYGNHYVHKQVTLPAWLDTWASQHAINYSQILQTILETQYESDQ